MKLFIIFLLLSSFLFAQDSAKTTISSAANNYSLDIHQSREKKFSKKALTDDFIQMWQTLKENHAAIYEYTSEEVMESFVEKQFETIKDSMTLSEFYKVLTPITAKIGCGHTAVWMPSSYWDIEPKNLFPLKIKLIENNVVVTGDYNDTIQVPSGSILQEINDRPVEDIIEEMSSNYSADAFNIHFINSQIQRRFPLVFARRFGFPAKYEVKYALPGRKTSENMTLIPATNQAVRAVIFSNFNHPPLTFQLMKEKNTAVLTIPTFIYYDKVPYFTDFIDSCFTLIKERNVGNLILDLRGNDGGDPFCAAPLFSYLQPEPLPYFSEPYEKYAELANPLLLPENQFTGNLITLMDGRCFSTNAHFCSLLKYHQIGTIVGTPSGGTFTCNAGKNGIEILENTKIQLYFGRSSFSTAVKGMDKSKPIFPDVYVNETYRDFLENRDVFMEKAFEQIVH